MLRLLREMDALAAALFLIAVGLLAACCGAFPLAVGCWLLAAVAGVISLAQMGDGQ